MVGAWPRCDGLDGENESFDVLRDCFEADTGDRRADSQRDFGRLDATDYAVLRAIREAIPNASNRPPNEVFQHAPERLRSAEAKLIESTHTENPSEMTVQKPE